MSGNLQYIPFSLDVLRRLVPLALTCLDAPQTIKNEAELLNNIVGVAKDLRERRIQMQSLVQMPGDEAHPKILPVFRFEKYVWQQLFIINNSLRPSLKPAKRDLENLVEGKTQRWRTMHLGRIVTYSLFEASGADARRISMERLRNEINQVLGELDAYQAK